MKKTQQILATITSLIILTFFVSSVQAQVWVGDYTITDSAHIAALSGYTEVTGNLTINTSYPVQSLQGLESLTTVGGDLIISNNEAITNLYGLNNLTTVGGDLIIDSNDYLSFTNGLNNLTTIGGDFRITLNPSLRNMYSLENLTSIGGTLHFRENSNLNSLSALVNLTSAGRLYLFYNRGLTSLNGLENLTSLGSIGIYNSGLDSISALSNITSLSGGLTFVDTGLTSYNGLENLTSVGGTLSIYFERYTTLSGLENLTSVGNDLDIDNSYLTSLSGLENITSVGGELYIGYNHALTNLCALYNVTGLNMLIIANHDVLSMETAYALETELRNTGFTGTAEIHDNNGSGLVSCDLDNDTVTDAADNCPDIWNPNQADSDNDGIGDWCDVCPNDPLNDNDEDGVCHSVDNCPDVANPGQEDSDSDDVGDACDNCPNDDENDADSDDVCGDIDNCPMVENSGQQNADDDIRGDVCDPDTVYGTVSGDVQAGVTVELYKTSCGGDILEDTTTTNSEGYYSFGGLENNRYLLSPEFSGYSFSTSYWVDIPQAEMQSYDFTTTWDFNPLSIGIWGAIRLNTVQVYISFNNDGSFFLSDQTPPEPSPGFTYTISGNQITFIDDICGSDEGIYTYSINGNTLSLAEISDPCSRKTILEGDWTKQ